MITCFQYNLKSSMKSVIISILICSFILSCSLLAGDASKVNEYVKVDIKVKQKYMKPGETGELKITFKPKSGIHINLDPPLSIKIDSTADVRSSGKFDIPKSTKKGYFDITKTAKQQFTLSRKITSGTVLLKGMLSYFYCSDTDGWCSRFKQPFEFTISIKK